MGSYNVSETVFRRMLQMNYPRAETGEFKRNEASVGGPHGQMIVFCAGLHPDWKLSGVKKDKVLLRKAASGRDPVGYATREKTMFRASFSESLFSGRVKFIDQLLSRESLRRTPWFDAARVVRH